MFFALSKILAFLISPINWILLAVLAGLAARNRKWKKRAFITSFILFLVFTNGFLANKSMKLLEVDSLGRGDLTKTYEAGILLGGLVVIQSDTGQVNFNANADRLFQTIDLYRSGYIEKIIISSGSGLLQLPSFKESYLIKKYLVRIGLPAEDIWIETNSRNTYENAVETKKLLDEKFGAGHQGEFLLITSTSHMRRSIGCFERQGIKVLPYSAGKRSVPGPKVFYSESILPDPYALQQWKSLMHEAIGMVMYRVTGKI